MPEWSETNPERVGVARLQDVSYDPFGVMPAEVPPHPRVLATDRQLARTRRLALRRRWARLALERLVASARSLRQMPPELPVPADHALNSRVIAHAEHNALAHHLTGDAACREQALVAMRLLARAYPRWPLNEGLGRACALSLSETRVTAELAQTYDLLAATGLEAEDERLFLEMFEATRETIDAQPHRTCGNHNTWGNVAALSVGVALGDRQRIHDALYGWVSGGHWRYGLIHQLRHDILADGLHWERAPGYHFYTLMGLVEAAWMCANIGVDLWHLELPTQLESDGADLHRAYGPPGRTKCRRAGRSASERPSRRPCMRRSRTATCPCSTTPASRTCGPSGSGGRSTNSPTRPMRTRGARGC